MMRSKLSAALYLALVFLSGSLVGAFTYRLYSANTVSATVSRRLDPVEWRRRYMQEMRTQVGTDAVSQVLKEFWPDIKQKFFKKKSDN